MFTPCFSNVAVIDITISHINKQCRFVIAVLRHAKPESFIILSEAGFLSPPESARRFQVLFAVSQSYSFTATRVLFVRIKLMP